MKKTIYITILFLMIFNNRLSSQDSIINNLSVSTFKSKIEITGILNPKLKLDKNLLDKSKLKVYGNDEPCVIETIEKRRDTIIVHIFFVNEDAYNKKDSLFKIIKELGSNCNGALSVVCHVINKVDSLKKKEDTLTHTDPFTSEIEYVNTPLFDFLNISAFVDSLEKLQKSKYLFILYSNGKDEDVMDTFSQLVDKKRNDNIYYGNIYYSKDKLKLLVFFENKYQNIKTSIKGWFTKDSIINTQTVNSKLLVYDKIENISSDYLCVKLDSNINHYIRIVFNVDKQVSVSDTIHYELEYKAKGIVYLNSFEVTGIGKDKPIEIETQLIVLHTEYENNPNEKFLEKAKQLIENYSETQEINNNPDKLFEISENLWDFSPTEDKWYKEIKISLLTKQLLTKTIPEDRIVILDKLISLSPNNKEYKLEKYIIKGDLYSENKKYENALENYSSYLKLDKENKEILNKSKQTFNSAFEKYFNENDFASIYNLGKGYNDYYRSSFELRYYYYLACYIEKDYKMSLQGFNWLVDNWDNNQSYIKWNDAFIILEKLYSYNYQFDKAMKLNKRLYRDTISEETLDSYLKYLRLKHLIMISDAFPVFTQNMNSISNIKLLFAHIPKAYPSFINGYYLHNKSNGKINMIVEYSKISSLPAKSLDNIKQYPAIVQSKNDDLIWIVNEQGDNLIIIEFSLIPIDNAERNLLSRINTNRLMVEPWEDLANYEAQFLQKYCTGVLAGMISLELDMGLSGNIYNYWEAIHVNSKLIYMLKYDKEGEIEQNKSFLANKLGELSSLWVKSETTKTFFKQEITYNSNKLEDITNPLLKNKKWNGTLKIGFKK